MTTLRFKPGLSLHPTRWLLGCRFCIPGTRVWHYITEAEYHRQRNRLATAEAPPTTAENWTCPSCGGGAELATPDDRTLHPGTTTP